MPRHHGGELSFSHHCFGGTAYAHSILLPKTPYTPCARAYLQPTRREESLVFAFSDVDLSDLFDLSDLS